MSKKYEIIRPKSLIDGNYADFEYLLRWIGYDGSDLQYMFYDAELKRSVNTEPINLEDADTLQSLVKDVENEITLEAFDLSENDIKVIRQIFENPIVYRIFKDGTSERYAPQRNSFKYRLRNGRYNIEFKLARANTKIWR